MAEINQIRSDLELVPFGTDSSLHREDILELSEKDGRPMGHEQLREDGMIKVSFAKRESNKMSPEDFDCLKAYYCRQYDTSLIVTNRVQKIKKTEVLGYVYRSLLYSYSTDHYLTSYESQSLSNSTSACSF